MKLHSLSLSKLSCIQVKHTGGKEIFGCSLVPVYKELTAFSIAQTPFLLSPRQLQKSRTAQLLKGVGAEILLSTESMETAPWRVLYFPTTPIFLLYIFSYSEIFDMSAGSICLV